MPPETAKLLLDMKSAAERIGRFVSGTAFADHPQDEPFRSGIARQCEIFGEALTRLIKRDLVTAALISAPEDSRFPERVDPRLRHDR
jgi:uncharacterized protein with HEPN domain